MISLFIDTSYYNLIIALYQEDEELLYYCEKNDNQLSTRLLPLIEKAFQEVNKKIQDIDKIYVVNGPGSFTGIRIGVVTAKTIGWALGKKVIPISELEVLSSVETKKAYIMPMIDARRGYVYAGVYRNDLKPLIKDKYILKEDIIQKAKEKRIFEDLVCVSYDSFENVTVEIPKICIKRIIQQHKNDEGVNSHSLIPNYLKKTEAEEKKHQKN